MMNDVYVESRYASVMSVRVLSNKVLVHQEAGFASRLAGGLSWLVARLGPRNRTG